MNFFQVVNEAFRSMGANRLRTVLTMLGIIIGITSVTLLLALGDSMQRFIGNELEALGTNMLYVLPGGSRTDERRLRNNAAPSLTMADAMALNALPSLTGSAPTLQGSFKVAAGNETSTSMVFGVTPEMFKIRNWKLDQAACSARRTCARPRAWW
jgi:putative ABC transport system permease protein